MAGAGGSQPDHADTGLPDAAGQGRAGDGQTPSLKVTRPESTTAKPPTSEPVFVRTCSRSSTILPESSDVHTRYDGRAASPSRRRAFALLAAISEGDWNIVLTNAFSPESRMMIRRRFPDRLGELAHFSAGMTIRTW